jgi:uncharacterized coiled-coil protein SlyX
MSRFVAGILVLSLLLSVCAIAAEGPATAKPKPAAKKKAPTMAEQLQALQNQINQQQSQMKQQQDQINGLQQQLQQSNSQLQAQSQQMQSSVQQANQSAAAAQQAANGLNSSVADLKSTTGNLAKEVDATKKRVMDLETPLAVHYKGVTFSPGAMVAPDFWWRSRSDAGVGGNTAWSESIFTNSIPFAGQANANLKQVRLGAQESKIMFRADTQIGTTKLLAYYDMDFAGRANTGNESQTYSMTPRLRDFYVQADTASGWQITGGMGWTLMTPNTHGCCSITDIWALIGFDFNINAGFPYVRAPLMRVAKNIGKKAWFGVEVVNPITNATTQAYQNYSTTAGNFGQSSLTLPWTYGNYIPLSGGATYGAEVAPNGSVAGITYTNPAGIAMSSTNVMPDVDVKLAFEPGFGHWEIKGLARWFNDRPICNVTTGCTLVNGTNFGQGKNNTATGWGIGGDFILPVIKKNNVSKLDLLANGLTGKGLGRYSNASDPDVTLKPNGSVVAVPVTMAVFGFEAHPSPKLDVYVYYGVDYAGKTVYPVTAYNATAGTGTPGFTQNGWIGFGVPNALQTYCNTEGGGATLNGVVLPCNTANRQVQEFQIGFWHHVWAPSSKGDMKWGLGYAWAEREVWSGALPVPGATATTVPYGIAGLSTLKTPIGVLGAFQASLRYQLP